MRDFYGTKDTSMISKQLGDREYQKFREDGTGKPAIAVVNADGSSIGGGVQYAEGDTDSSFTGTMLMFEYNTDEAGVVSDDLPLPVALNQVTSVDVQNPNVIFSDTLVTSSNPLPVYTPPGTTAATSSVGDTITSTQLIAANAARKEVEFYNNSSAILYLLKGTGTASSANYTVQLNQGDYYTTDITSALTGVWASDAGGSVLITEST